MPQKVLHQELSDTIRGISTPIHPPRSTGL
jgi:hypothetical protein